MDFFSIYNDLTQYVMAAEPGNASVAELVTSVQPPVLHAIRQHGGGPCGRHLGRYLW